MNVTRAIVSVLSFLVFLCFGAYLFYKKPIKVERKIKPWSWIIIHVCVCVFTLLFMVTADEIYLSSEQFNYSIPIIGPLLYIFIRNGGLVVFVMLFSSIIYDFSAKLCNYQYFVERHIWVKKLFFSLVCVLMVLLYVIEFEIIYNADRVFSDEYSFISAWIIALFGIWIGFGTRIYGIEELKNAIKQEFEELKEQEERRSVIWCVVSMIVPMLFVFSYYFFRRNFTELAQSIYTDLLSGVTIGLASIMVVAFLWKRKCRPNLKNSKKRYKKLLANIDDEKGIEYYLDVKYELDRREKKIVLIIYGEEIELVDKENYKVEFTEKLACAFKEKEVVYDETCADEIEKELCRIAEERKELLKQAWEVAYNVCDEKEIDLSIDHMKGKYK